LQLHRIVPPNIDISTVVFSDWFLILILFTEPKIHVGKCKG
jgi:hypothetical protein